MAITWPAERLQPRSGPAWRSHSLIQARFDVLATTATLKRAVGVSPSRPLTVIPELANANSTGEDR